MKIATWKATTLKNNYRIEILTAEFRCFQLDLLGVSETQCQGVGNMKLDDIEFSCSGRKDGVYRQEVGLMMNKGAVKSCLG